MWPVFQVGDWVRFLGHKDYDSHWYKEKHNVVVGGIYKVSCVEPGMHNAQIVYVEGINTEWGSPIWEKVESEIEIALVNPYEVVE